MFCFGLDDILMSYDFYESELVIYHEVDFLSVCLVLVLVCRPYSFPSPWR
jgi:hypothetical protein